MSSIGQLIKQLALEGAKPISLQIVEGTIISSTPLQLRLKDDPKLIIPSEFITVPERLKNHSRTVDLSAGNINAEMAEEGEPEHTHLIKSLSLSNAQLVFNDGLKTGDKVMVAVSGQSFFILDRI